MRQLSPRTAHGLPKGRQRGLTLVELMVGFAIASLLALAAAPYLSDYGINSKLREGGNALYAEALFAQSEAIKRNRVMRVLTNGRLMLVSDMTDPAVPITVRAHYLPEGSVMPPTVFSFGSSGATIDPPLMPVAVDLSHQTAICSDQFRCPGLRIDAGGAIRLCANKLDAC